MGRPRAWLYAPSFGAIEQEAGGQSPDLLLDPAQLIPSLDHVVGERVRCLTWGAIELRARPRPSEPYGITLDRGADEHRLLVDVEIAPEVLERDGAVYRVVQPERATTFRPRQVVLDRDGTSVEINSDLDLELLLGLAASLSPASPEPPRLV